VALDGMKALEKKKLAIHAKTYMIISGDLYKMARDEVLHHYQLEHEHITIMEETH
ncbi:hypothetical protein KI387_032917, partial [Taxus chinensis]